MPSLLKGLKPTFTTSSVLLVLSMLAIAFAPAVNVDRFKDWERRREGGS